MSGHSKWANIKHKKGAADKKRGAVFTKVARSVTIAAREGGGDPETNFGLRLAIDKARAANMPKDKIAAAIARGAGDAKGEELERVYYEGYGPNSSAVMISALTDNRNRTVGEIRHAFSRYGGNLGESGSVAWQFEQRGMISVPADGVDADDLALEAIDAGAVDVEVESDLVTVYTEVTDFQRVKESLAGSGFNTDESELAMVPTAPVELSVNETVSVLKFVEALEDLDDVDQVWTNVEISDEAAEQFAAA
ncbi:MAG: YebC/PmpR family DNA-binding transcriptional regulator [Anaerolineae bacterium]|jgi:YebC/PmpR family DNA-binding regulatory protein